MNGRKKSIVRNRIKVGIGQIDIYFSIDDNSEIKRLRQIIDSPEPETLSSITVDNGVLTKTKQNKRWIKRWNINQ